MAIETFCVSCRLLCKCFGVRKAVMATLRTRRGHYIFVLFLLMVALWNRADHYIFILWFLLLSI